ncbi:MAG: patatin-like phospholipase family protein [Porticoccaceae bacterium]|nr:patatin-like phospholipase family protein [Porticoccaceae bacterium]
MTTALILSGGGARAAYQAGVLKAVAKILPANAYNPFPIICGTSAGAINTLALVGRQGSFNSRVMELENLWRNLTAEKVYRTDCLSVLSNTVKLALSVFLNTAGIPQPLALLDNAPLKKLLEEIVNFHDMDEAIASGYLKAVAITAMSYSTGQSISFFQGDHDNWKRARRMGLRTGLTLDHLMASAAIPTLFPPVKIGTSYFGDGALRQLKPLSPALHLGADRLFVIGVSDNAVQRNRPEASYRSPTIAQMIGHMLNSAFIDTLESDLETLRAINNIARSMDASDCEYPDSADIKYIEYLTITPSMAINELAEHYVHELPRTVRTFLRVTGAKAGQSGSSAASYLLFEPGFCGQLIDMGYEDTLKQKNEVLDFFRITA